MPDILNQHIELQLSSMTNLGGANQKITRKPDNSFAAFSVAWNQKTSMSKRSAMTNKLFSWKSRHLKQISMDEIVKETTED